MATARIGGVTPAAGAMGHTGIDTSGKELGYEVVGEDGQPIGQGEFLAAMSQMLPADGVVATSDLAFGATTRVRLGARRAQKFVLAPGNKYAGGRDGGRLVLQNDIYFSGSEPMLDSALARLSSADSVVMQGALMVTDDRVYRNKRVRPFLDRLRDVRDTDAIYRSLQSLGVVDQAPIFFGNPADGVLGSGLSVFHLHLEDLSDVRFPTTQYTFYRGGVRPVVVEGLSTLYLKAGDMTADRIRWQRWFGAIGQIKVATKSLFDAIKTSNRGRGGEAIITALERIMLDTEASYRKYLTSPAQDVLISQDDMTTIANFFSKVWDYIETARAVGSSQARPLELDDKYRELTRVFEGPVFVKDGVR